MVETFRRVAVVQFAIESIKLLFLDTADGSYDFHVERQKQEAEEENWRDGNRESREVSPENPLVPQCISRADEETIKDKNLFRVTNRPRILNL